MIGGVLQTVGKISPALLHRIRQQIHIRALPPRYREAAPGTLFVMSDRPAGFFSLFFQVLGAVDFCRLNRHNLELDFGQGPYVDPSRGNNWWRYYFQGASFNFAAGAPGGRLRIESQHDQHCFADYGKNLPPEVAARIMAEAGIVPDTGISRKVSEFAEREFRGQQVVGVHYRGTDKASEALRVPYQYLARLLTRYRECLFFVATDEEPFVDYLRERFPGRVLQYDALRSRDGIPLHFGSPGAQRHRIGAEALIDCLLLSRCHTLLRTESNLSLACSFFNPRLQVVEVTRKYQASPRRRFPNE